ncbi:hypothetical protein BDN72DRAFT_731602, partial [Pluteus cervinus]
GASFDSAERPDPLRCHPDTRQVVRTHFISSGDKRSLDLLQWLFGWAGTGKSAIAQTVAEFFSTKDRLAGSFFFFRASSDRNTIQKIVPSLAYQLSFPVPGAGDYLRFIVSRDATIFDGA